MLHDNDQTYKFDHRIQHDSDFLTATVPPTDDLILIHSYIHWKYSVRNESVSIFTLKIKGWSQGVIQ